MKTYNQALEAIVEKIRSSHDYYQYQMYTAVEIIYGVPYETIHQDAQAIIERIEFIKKEKEKAQRIARQLANRIVRQEARRLKVIRDPKQRKMNFGV
jgi:hypothetical protein